MDTTKTTFEDQDYEQLTPPDMATLIHWMMEEGGCEAQCVHGCWVEPDGYCEHKRPSWLLALGLI